MTETSFNGPAQNAIAHEKFPNDDRRVKYQKSSSPGGYLWPGRAFQVCILYV